jgi:D-alanyl-lipoteichoic acid acyltransferase DltB (MBOAT superfamily)
VEILSLPFAAFVVFSLVGFHVVPARWRAPWLLFSSYVSYGAVAPRFLPLLLAISLSAIFCGRRVVAYRGRRRFWLCLGIALPIGAMAVARIVDPRTPFVEPVAAIGLSFFSLQAISYLADLYSGSLREPARWHEVALYLAYFPKVTAGPIERTQRFVEQLRRPAPVDDAAIGRALTLVSVGLFRKIAIADRLMAESASLGGGATTAMAILRFVFALYNDFAAYTEIVRGISLLFGIELTRNFAQPFFASSFTDLWNRWHASLSYWLRDYVFMPVTRALLRRDPNPNSPANAAVAPIATMLASGLWHGATPHMMLWGLLNGLYLVGERLILRIRRAAGLRSTPLDKTIAVFAVFLLTALAFVPFRLDVHASLQVWLGLFTALGAEWPGAALLVPVALSLWLDRMQLRHGDETTFDHWPRLLRAAAASLGFLLCVLLAAETSPSRFIYQGF